MIYCIPANRPDFIGAVAIFDFQNLQNSGRPGCLEFQPVNIPVFKVIFKTQISIFPGLFSANREETFFANPNRTYEWFCKRDY